jgi:hypothetical protein
MPIPSNTFFPASFAARVAWLQNFLTNLTPVAPMLGYPAGGACGARFRRRGLSMARSTTLSVENFKASVRASFVFRSRRSRSEIRSRYFRRRISTLRRTRRVRRVLFQRLIEMIDRIRTAPAYTNEIGASLGILPAHSNGIARSRRQTDRSKSSLRSPTTFSRSSCPIAPRRIRGRWWSTPKGGAWSYAGTFTGKSADVTYAPATPVSRDDQRACKACEERTRTTDRCRISCRSR